jgi:polyhydroxyalkanoate synthesis repressor PhaR
MSRVIKRYENRKLYDAQDRKYVSLNDIAALIREGVDVQIIDNATEADITAQTLTQVIFEEGKQGRNPLSSEILHDAIRWSNNLLDDSLKQVRHGLDQIMPASLSKLFGKEKTDDISELKKRIESLENIILSLGEKINLASAEKTAESKTGILPVEKEKDS